ncbi:MAG: HAD family hydrolase [Tannerellaceae bacterium]|nr:HAD family hydrolase [Tannerellaceae bacterium]
MIKLVAFDLDGTIGDTIPMCIAAFQEAVSPYAGNFLTEEEIIQTFGLNEEGMIRQIVKERWEEALDSFYIRYEAMHYMAPTPFKGIKELIRELKSRHITVALITGKGKGSCDITLKQFGMETVFDRVATGSPEKNIKADILRSIRQEYDIQPDEMVYVGDTVADILSCREAGIQCLSVAWATSANPEQLENHNPGYVFLTVEGLTKYLLKENI